MTVPAAVPETSRDWVLIACKTIALLAAVSCLGCKPERTMVAPAEQAAPEPAEQPRPNLVKRKTQVVLDFQQAKADNPALIEVENKIDATDPLTGSLQGYIALSSRANVLNFQHQVNLMKAAEDRNPTYQEIINLIKQTNMEFNALPDYQNYAYDQTDGRFTILEDPEAKEKFQNPQ